tara:strand:- start:330 stop:770 length:441 start_codon:yes stop_codon:yes gene_type:complete
MSENFKEAFEKTEIAGAIASGALDEVSKVVKPGISTDQIDKVCYEFINDHKAYSAPLFYRGFPKSCCTSTNHVVCHGVPSNKILKEGDILNVVIESGNSAIFFFLESVTFFTSIKVLSFLLVNKKSNLVFNPNFVSGFTFTTPLNS